MPQAVSQPVREEIVARHLAGDTLSAIAQAMMMSYRTVRALWSRYRARGSAGLAADYERCGSEGPRFPTAMYEAALSLKREHPRWGAVLVKIQLALQFSEQPLPSKRTLQAWFARAGIQQRRTRRPGAPRQWARAAHEVWQLDGKEEILLADGTRSAVLSLVDEATGAVLSTAVFPPGQVYSGIVGGRPGLAEERL
jgi:transposase